MPNHRSMLRSALLTIGAMASAAQRQAAAPAMPVPSPFEIASLLEPFTMHLEGPCASAARPPPACLAELRQLPDRLSSIMDGMLNGNFAALPEYDMNRLCSVCPPDVLMDAFDGFARSFEESADDPTCGGSVPVRDTTTLLQTMRVTFASMCATDGRGQMCWNADGIPAALQRARIPQMAADALTNAQAGDTPPNMNTMMANLDLRSLCQGLSSGGCCMGIALDVNKAMMDLNCMSAAGRYTDMLRMMCRMTAPIATACPTFRLPAYTPPSQCPPVEQTLARLQALTPLSSTEYGNCTVPAGACPRNACELYFCKPAAMAQ